jgi:hypothetical protein
MSDILIREVPDEVSCHRPGGDGLVDKSALVPA